MGSVVNSTNTNLAQIAFFMATFGITFQFLLHYMPRKYLWFAKLSHNHQIGSVLRFLSSIHALAGTVLSLIILITDHELSENKLLYSSFWISFTLNLSIGFLCFDAVVMFVHRHEFEIGYGIHHFVSIIAFYTCTTAGVFPFIALSRLISEASTVFINFRWQLLTLDMKNSGYYYWNCFAIVIVFALVRIVTIIPNWMVYISLTKTDLWTEIALAHKCVCFFSTVPLDILNTFWFVKIIRILIKQVRDAVSKTKDSSKNE